MKESRRRLHSCLLFLPMLTLLASCQKPAAGPAASAEAASRAHLRLEQIKPTPQLPADVAPLSSEPVPQALRYLRTGQERFDERLWADATTALEKSLQIDPHLAEARVLLARAALQHGNSSLAESHLKEAMKLRPRDPAIYQLLGEITLQDHRGADAIASFRTALLAGPAAPNSPAIVLAHLSLALALKEEGYLAAAADELEAFADATATPTKEMSGYHELKEAMLLYRGKIAAMIGDLQVQLGAFDRAIVAYQRAAAENPDDQSVRHRLTLALARGGRSSEAIDHVRQVLKETPDDAQALELLKDVCELAHQPARFDAELVELAKQAKSPAMQLRLAKMLLEKKKAPEAADVLTRLVEEQPDHTEAAYLLARICLDQKKVRRALEQIAKVLRDHPTTYREASGLFFTLGEPKVDAAEVRVFVEQHPKDAVAQYLLAISEWWNTRNAQAAEPIEQAAKKCLQLDEKFAPAQVLLGTLAVMNKQWEEAVKLAQAAIDNGIADANVYLIKGTALEALDRFQDAETALLESFRLDRKSADSLFVLAESAERRRELLRCEQIYRRILDDVEPKHVQARERLVTVLLNTQKVDKAREYFSDFERLGQSGAEPERCLALMNLAGSRAPTGQERLEEYRAALGEIIRKYPKDPATYVESAKSYEAVGELESALKQVDAALKIDLDDFRALDRKARYQAKLLDFDGATRTSLALLRLRPRDLAYQQRLIEFAISRGELDEAAQRLKTLLTREDLKETRDAFVRQLKTVLVVSKRADEAVHVAKDWLDLAPTEPARRDLYVETLQEAKRPDEAVEMARQWLSADPTNGDLRAQYIDQLIGAKRCVEGQQRVLAWLASDADDLDLNRLLLRLFWAGKQWDSAIELAQTGIETSEQRPAYEVLLGFSYRLARRFDEAIDFYRERAVNPAAVRTLIEALIEAERFEEAEKLASGALTPHQARREGEGEIDLSTVLRMRQYLVRIYQLMGRENQAGQQLEEIRRLAPDDPGVNNDLGYTWADAGIHLDDAEKMIRFALSEKPTTGAYIDSLGWVLYKRGRFDEAIVYTRRAILLINREDATLFDHLADALYRTGKIDEARENWKKALTAHPSDDEPGASEPNAEDRRILKKIKAKLEALEQKKEVPVAPLAKKEATSQPAPAADKKHVTTSSPSPKSPRTAPRR